MESADVIVIGAGVAGLSAAKSLHSENPSLSVIVLEGRDQIGGRIRTQRSALAGEFPIELGAQWIHRQKGNPISTILQSVPLPQHQVTDYDNAIVFDLALAAEVKRKELGKMWSEFKTISKKLTKMQDDDKDLTLASAVEKIYNQRGLSPELRRRMNFFFALEVETEYATSLEDLSMFWWDDDEEFNGVDWIVTHGYDQIPQYLSEGLDIRLNSPVATIEYEGSTAESTICEVGGETVIRTLSGTSYRCRKVIVAVPLGVLKNNKIQFSPPLPRPIVASISSLGMGVMNKIFLQFDGPFWPNSKNFIYFMQPQIDRASQGFYPLFFNINFHYPGSNTLCVFECGRSAVASERLSEPERVAAIMAQLRVIFPAAPDPTSFVLTSWSQDPFTFGSYSSVPLGASSAHRKAFAEPVWRDTSSAGDIGDGVLFFAGEHTSQRYPSTVHGARLSGLDAARKVQASLTSSAVVESKGPVPSEGGCCVN